MFIGVTQLPTARPAGILLFRHARTHTPAQAEQLVLVRCHQQVLRHGHVQLRAVVVFREGVRVYKVDEPEP